MPENKDDTPDRQPEHATQTVHIAGVVVQWVLKQAGLKNKPPLVQWDPDEGAEASSPSEQGATDHGSSAESEQRGQALGG